ncbi:MAG TPA: protein phosphatase 2C domain-containing protein [Dermatophilaceae bacterium]|nr:protein phosphatase 2C domain-containing protein [Dermatophilaceae bacterium]
MAVALRYAARSHLGLGPKGRNEDSGYAGPHLLVLADGMGGHAAGDVASSMIVGALAPLDDEGYNGEQALRVLGAELRDANDALRSAMSDDTELDGMGSTTIAMLRAGNKLAMAHIGDSRAYLLREGTFSQITKDHSFVQQLLDEHRITDEEAQHHPQRSLVTRVMTGGPDDEPDLSIREIMVGDRYLLCSDGLTDFVTAETVQEILTEAATPEQAAERCIEVALKAHTRDNVTVVVADVVEDSSADLPTTPEIVGAAAAARPRRTRTRAMPVALSPAEKAAALSREATGAPDPADEAPALAEETAPAKVLWLRRGVLAAAALVVLIGGLDAGYRWIQQQIFVGEDAATGYVAIYRGVDQQLGPIDLATLLQRTDVKVADLPNPYQGEVRGSIQAADLTDAANKVSMLRIAAQQCQASNAAGIPCGTSTPPGTPTPGPTTSSSATPAPTSFVTAIVTGADGHPTTFVHTATGDLLGGLGSVVTPSGPPLPGTLPVQPRSGT